MSQAPPPNLAVVNDSPKLARTYLLLPKWEGRLGPLAHSALKLSALHLSPVDYFENYIFEISRQNCIICTINCASTLTFIYILVPALCAGLIPFSIVKESKILS